ncbi:hypothetical protein G6F66_015385 [Rhizopus arrhizus]|nr:hypothetical protein G6F23_015843 [Rhizopus arrhizus]KAG1250312.1 hypothetical protein G6F66_015385 [Rhizopus arrhizus]
MLASASRHAAVATHPSGLCRVGIVYTARTGRRRHRSANASRSMPSPAAGTGASSSRENSAASLNPG